MRNRILVLGLSVCTFACQNQPEPIVADQPARMAYLGPSQLAEVSEHLLSVMPNHTITLTPTAFQNNSSLVLTSNPGVSPGISGGNTAGAALGRQSKPDGIFNLVVAGGLCALVHNNSGQRFPLSFSCESAAIPPTFTAQDVWIPSRNVSIPATLVRPLPNPGQTERLVILVHGHGGTRHEAGGFQRVAEGLAREGIASIRMDFPGCGESKESFQQNNLSNMLADIQAAERYARTQVSPELKSVGLLGFSMGGRLSMLTTGAHPRYDVVALWAPAGSQHGESLTGMFGGKEAYAQMRQQAQRDGYVPYTTPWGQYQELGFAWFTDMEASRPREAIGTFEGDLLVLYGDQDQVVVPAVSQQVIRNAVRARSVVEHAIPGADHGLGLFDNNPHFTDDAVNTTVNFFSNHL